MNLLDSRLIFTKIKDESLDAFAGANGLACRDSCTKLEVGAESTDGHLAIGIIELGAVVAKAKEQLVEKQADLEVKRSELDEIMEETRAEEDKLKEKVKDLESKIETRLLTSFKRIRKNARNGLGVVYVQRDACGGCFNKIPPQRQLDIKMHKKIIVCEYCGRIMIDPELAGVKITPTGVEEKKTRKRAIRKTVKKAETPAVPEEEA